MRHLHFVQSIEPLEGGGLGRAAFELNRALQAGGSVLVTTKAARQTESLDYIAWSRTGPTRAFYAPEMTRHASAIIGGADVIHGHGFYVAPNWILGREVRKQNKPLVYHAHGMFEPWILNRSRWKKRLAHLLFENANFKYAALWRALTDKEADQIRSRGITAPVIVCPNGIELATFDSIPGLRREQQKSKRELLFLARLHPKKGLLLLLDAWARLPQGLRDDWKIVIAGPDEGGHLAEVEACVKALKINDQVVFTGAVSGAEKLSILASADAFVLPSHSEGFSVAILEALACELPVLATDACNFPDLAVHGGGWCVAPTQEGIRAGLVELLSACQTELSQRAKLGRQLVERAYTWPQIALQLTTACREIIR